MEDCKRTTFLKCHISASSVKNIRVFFRLRMVNGGKQLLKSHLRNLNYSQYKTLLSKISVVMKKNLGLRSVLCASHNIYWVWVRLYPQTYRKLNNFWLKSIYFFTFQTVWIKCQMILCLGSDRYWLVLRMLMPFCKSKTLTF